MNIYTVRKATQGISEYLNERFDDVSVAIAYDSRKNSKRFAYTAAEVFAGNGIKVYLFDTLMPTPMLSFAVRQLGCSAGVVITASHNPAKYNGYKLYGNDGCQITLEVAEKITGYITRIDIFEDIRKANFKEQISNGMICYIGQDTIDAYFKAVKEYSVFDRKMCIRDRCVGTPVLVNGKSNVLHNHIEKSNAGLYFYQKEDFSAALNFMITNHKTAIAMGENGIQYVMRNYSWDGIIDTLQRAIEEIAEGCLEIGIKR